MRETATVTIDSIASGGAGVGRLDGMAVFVPRTAPGDRVTVALSRRKRHAEGRLRQILEASPARVEPPCQHYVTDRCGGCQLQHLGIADQRAAKRDMVQQALRRIAKRDAAVDEVVPSPLEWRYRRKLTLTLRPSPAGWRGGLRPFDDPDRIFALDDCLIAAESLVAAWHEVRGAAECLADVDEVRAELLQGDGGVSLNLIGLPATWPRCDEFLARCPSLVSVRSEGAHGVAVLRGDAASSGAFVQVNPAMAQVMQSHILSLAAVTPGLRVVDAYGGRGDVSADFVKAGAKVTLIELDYEATRSAKERLGQSARVVTARVEDALDDALPADLVLVNPPRTGVDARVCDSLESAEVSRLIYVSCDPATLARDLARLPSWRLERVTPFDMFPQTAHVETVCLLTRIIA